MKRFFAYRPLLFSALFLCLGILGAYFFYTQKIAEFVLACIIILGFLFAIVLYYLLPHIAPNFKFINFWKRFYDFIKKYLKFLAICICCSVLGFSIFNIAVNVYEKDLLVNMECQLSGVVTKYVNQNQSYTSFYLRDCVAYKTDGSKIGLDGVVSVITFLPEEYFTQEIEVGNFISFHTKISSLKIVDENKNINTFNYKFNIRYHCVLDSLDERFVLKQDNKTFAESVNQYVLEMLLQNMGQDEALLAWSVLFGDSTQLDDQVVEAFKISGVMHIIAVSGMNVVFIIAIILAFLKLIKVKSKKTAFFVSLIVLAFYTYLCAFTPSVVRASIMALVFLFARLSGNNGDIMSNIGASAFLILLIQPLMLFEPGFLLSFGSLLGIILVYSPIFSLFYKKIKIPKVLSQSLAVTISAQIGIYPILAMFFEYVSTYSFIANIIVVPIFEIAYIILFVLVIVVSIIPALSFTLYLPDRMFDFINWFPQLFVSLPQSVLQVFSIGFYSIAFYMLLVFLSRYIFIKKVTKIIICSVLSLIVVVGACATYVEYDLPNGTVLALSVNKGQSTLCVSNNEKILIGVGENYRDIDLITRIFNDQKIFSLDYVILWKEQTETRQEQANLMEIAKKYNPKLIYLPKYCQNNYTLLTWLNFNNYEYCFLEESAEFNTNFSLKAFVDDDKIYALYLGTQNNDCFFVNKNKADINDDMLYNYIRNQDLSRYIVLTPSIQYTMEKAKETDYFSMIQYAIY